jgi:hypothetical protein
LRGATGNRLRWTGECCAGRQHPEIGAVAAVVGWHRVAVEVIDMSDRRQPHRRGLDSRTGVSLSVGRAWRHRIVTAAVCLAAILMSVAPRWASAVTIHIDLSPLAVTSARLDFDLFDGDTLSNNNAVTISNLMTDGTWAVPPGGCSIGCNGGPTYQVSDDPFGQLLIDLAFAAPGTYVSFELAFTNVFVADGTNAPDRLTLNLLDPVTNFSLVDTDLDINDPVPVQDAVLYVDLKDPTDIVLAGRGVSVTVPEPTSLALVLLALAVLTRRRAGLGICARTGAA